MAKYTFLPFAAAIFTACAIVSCPQPASAQEKQVEQSYSEFAVPIVALRDFAVDHVVGELRVKSQPFSDWLLRNGVFAELVALSDRRYLMDALESAHRATSTMNSSSQSGKQNKGKEDEEHAIPDDRICDVAYQLICRKYSVPAMSYRLNRNGRDAKIKGLIDEIKKQNQAVNPSRR